MHDLPAGWAMRRRKLLGWIVFLSLLFASFLVILLADSLFTKQANGVILTTPIFNLTVEPGDALFFSEMTRESKPYIFQPSLARRPGDWGVTRIRRRFIWGRLVGIIAGEMIFPGTARGRTGHFDMWVLPGFDYRYEASNAGEWMAWSLRVSLLIPITLSLLIAVISWMKLRRQPAPGGQGAGATEPAGRNVLSSPSTQTRIVSA